MPQTVATQQAVQPAMLAFISIKIIVNVKGVIRQSIIVLNAHQRPNVLLVLSSIFRLAHKEIVFVTLEVSLVQF